MKSLKQYIFEKMSEAEFISWVKSEYNIDDKDANFDEPFNALNNTINFNNLFNAIDQYENDIKTNKKIEIKKNETGAFNHNNGYLLTHLFHISGLQLDEINKNLIKDILRKNKKLGNGEELNELIKFALNVNGSKNIENFKELTKYEVTSLKLDNFSNLAEYIYSIKNFSKSGSSTNIGPGELLLQLLFGYKTDNNKIHKGDVIIGNETLEVKSSGGRLKAAKNVLKSPNEMYKYFGDQLCGKFEGNKDTIEQIEKTLKNNKIGGYIIITKLFNSLCETLDALGYSEPGEIVFNCLKDMYKYQFIEIENIDKFNYEISYSQNDKNVGQSLIKYHTAYTLYSYQEIDEFHYFMILTKELKYLLTDKITSKNIDNILSNIKIKGGPDNGAGAMNTNYVSQISLI